MTTPTEVCLSIDIETGNDDLVSNPREATAAILEKLARRIRNEDCDCGPVFDANGNTIGKYSFWIEED